MLAPLSWLTEYVAIKLPPKELAARLTEVGLGVERIIEEGKERIFEFEITPNRPDWLSMVGITREIAAIQGTKLKYPDIPSGILTPSAKDKLLMDITTDFAINPRFSGIIIDGITVKDSPEWLKKRLEQIGQRPINNIVDITNYVMFELGNPIHAFDYDKITGRKMVVELAIGGEEFKSVDGISYHLPKGAIIIRDKEKIIDLCGIKGGYNTGTFPGTKTIFIRVPVEDPILIRKASQTLGLRSDASSIFERGVNRDGTLSALKRCVQLILEVAGGAVASGVYDLKEHDVTSWNVTASKKKIHSLTGVSFSDKEIKTILENLSLSPEIIGDRVTVTVPTYRNDILIEEDVVEEIVRLYGYGNLPKTIPKGEIQTTHIPYFRDFRRDEDIKQFMKTVGFSEIYTYSLVSEKDLELREIKPDIVLRVDNPVSRDYEYLRPTLSINLVKALKANQPYASSINLFELGKVYLGKSVATRQEPYFLSAISNEKTYYEIKGIVEALYRTIGISEDPQDVIEILPEGVLFEISYAQLMKKAVRTTAFKPLPKYPSIVEDMAIVADSQVTTGEITTLIRKQSELITDVSLIDQFKDTRTFHIVYQHKERNLTNDEIKLVREQIVNKLKKTLDAQLKA